MRSTHHGRTGGRLALGGALFGLAAVLLTSGLAESYPKYRTDSGGGCVACHGAFNDGTSPAGHSFPFDSKHLMHRASSTMNTSCSLCHYEGDELNPDLDHSDSDGFGGGPGFGCLGCHGRDYGPTLGVMGAGLRQHHRTVGVSSCGASSCHQNDPVPLPETVPPPYYGSFQTRAWDSCNVAPYFGESFSLGDTQGLDNDGDDLYDGADPDCASLCPPDLDGDGEVGFGDILRVIASWGPCGSCPADLNLDGAVGFGDILVVIANWGPC